jgi:hypothetical protein
LHHALVRRSIALRSATLDEKGTVLWTRNLSLSGGIESRLLLSVARRGADGDVLNPKNHRSTSKSTGDFYYSYLDRLVAKRD